MFAYLPLPGGSCRLLRLLPHTNENSPIECQIITCPLLYSKKAHPYEALSYVWGPESNQRPISLDGDEFLVRENLHQALFHLRDEFVERVLWVDAICINQHNDNEKSHQVQSMAKIYAKASRVVVWLGAASDDSDLALESLRMAAEEGKMTARRSWDPTFNGKAILSLLERDWFQRIWVLQEVAAARHVLIKAGSTEIEGHAFCLGLDALNLSFKKHPHLRGLIPPITHLISKSVLRPRFREDETSQNTRFFLNICPLAELVEMCHTRKASVALDKIFALLGMSEDNPHKAGLEADYGILWGEAFRKLIQFCISDKISIHTWDGSGAAVLEGNGCILGQVTSTRKRLSRGSGRLRVNVTWNYAPQSFGASDGETGGPIILPVSWNTVQRGDLVCLLQGAQRLSIIRPEEAGLSPLIVIAVPSTEKLREWFSSIQSFPNPLLLVWDWGEY